MAGDVNPTSLGNQIVASMQDGHSQTVALGGGATLVLNGATLSFAVLAPVGIGGSVGHG